jgi:hypothetical protein
MWFWREPARTLSAEKAGFSSTWITSVYAVNLLKARKLESSRRTRLNEAHCRFFRKLTCRVDNSAPLFDIMSIACNCWILLEES